MTTAAARSIPVLDSTPMPSARRLPLLGSLPFVLRDPLGFLSSTRHRGNVVELDLGVGRIVLLHHADAARHVLRDQVRNYGKGGAMFRSFRKLLGDGLVTSQGELWRRQRQMIQPQFHRRRLESTAGLMLDAIDEGLADWRRRLGSRDEGDSLDLRVELPRLTMKVIVRTMFGSGVEPTEADRVTEALEYVQDAMLRGVLTDGLPAWLPVPGRRRFRDAVATIDELVFRVIERRRGASSGGVDSADARGDFVSLLLDAVDTETGRGMDDRQLRDEAVTMFSAGYETTATALAWTFALLSRHRRELDLLRKEVDEVLGDRRPTFADLPSVARARRVVQESLRLYPPAWWIERKTAADDSVQGHHVAAGSSVVVLVHSIHRHPDLWQDPERFDSDRFLPAQTAGRHPLAWLPFGSGPRQCIGREFSLMESQLAVIRVLQSFDLECVDEPMPPVHVGATLKPKGPVRLRLTPRRTDGGVRRSE
ncbi:MAG: cytochrome P450 [Acidobacteriota bacterium]